MKLCQAETFQRSAFDPMRREAEGEDPAEMTQDKHKQDLTKRCASLNLFSSCWFIFEV